MNYCKDCIHVAHRENLNIGKNIHPDSSCEKYRSLLNGDPIYCYSARADERLCGFDGIGFEGVKK